MAETIGQLPDGSSLQRATISNGALTASVITYGAAIQNLKLAGIGHPLVLGLENPLDYPHQSAHFGAITGRVANRISGSRFTLGGEIFSLDRNENGMTTLHGGGQGISRRNWQLVSAGADHATLEIIDEGAVTGFPGNCRIECTYSITGDATLRIELMAESDRPSPCNLAHHSYFNLDGCDTILDHELQIYAEHYLPVDMHLIPIGEITAVEGTPFDFRKLRKIAHRTFTDYDHNYCLADAHRPLAEIARARGSDGRVGMSVWSTEPGVQLYAGGNLHVATPGLGGRQFGKHAGFCLEAQNWPDAPNRPEFPQSIAAPGAPYRQEAEYRFALAD